MEKAVINPPNTQETDEMYRKWVSSLKNRLIMLLL